MQLNKRWLASKLLLIFIGFILVSIIVIFLVPSWRTKTVNFFSKFGPKADVAQQQDSEEYNQWVIKPAVNPQGFEAERGNSKLITKVLRNDIYLPPPSLDKEITWGFEYDFSQRNQAITREKNNSLLYKYYQDRCNQNLKFNGTTSFKNYKDDQSQGIVEIYPNEIGSPGDNYYTQLNLQFLSPLYIPKNNTGQGSADTNSGLQIFSPEPGKEFSFTIPTPDNMYWEVEAGGIGMYPNIWVLHNCPSDIYVSSTGFCFSRYGSCWASATANTGGCGSKPSSESSLNQEMRGVREPASFVNPENLTINGISPWFGNGDNYRINSCLKYAPIWVAGKLHGYIFLKNPYKCDASEGEMQSWDDYLNNEDSQESCSPPVSVTIKQEAKIRPRSELLATSLTLAGKYNKLNFDSREPIIDLVDQDTDQTIPEKLGQTSDINESNEYTVTLTTDEKNQVKGGFDYPNPNVSNPVVPIFLYARKISSENAVKQEFENPKVEDSFKRRLDAKDYRNKPVNILVPLNDKSEIQGELGYIKKIAEEKIAATEQELEKTVYKYKFTPIESSDYSYTVYLDELGKARDSEGNILAYKPKPGSGKQAKLDIAFNTNDSREGIIEKELTLDIDEIEPESEIEVKSKVYKRCMEEWINTKPLFTNYSEGSYNPDDKIKSANRAVDNIWKRIADIFSSSIGHANAQDQKICNVCDSESGCGDGVLLPGDYIELKYEYTNRKDETLELEEIYFSDQDKLDPYLELMDTNEDNLIIYINEKEKLKESSVIYHKKFNQSLVLKSQDKLQISLKIRIRENLDTDKYNKLNLTYNIRFKNIENIKASYTKMFARMPRPELELVEILDENNQSKSEHQDKLFPGDKVRYKVVIEPKIGIEKSKMNVYLPEWVQTDIIQGNGQLKTVPDLGYYQLGNFKTTQFITWEIENLSKGDKKEYFFTLKLDKEIPFFDKQEQGIDKLTLHSELYMEEFIDSDISIKKYNQPFYTTHKIETDIAGILTGKITGPYGNPVPGVTVSLLGSKEKNKIVIDNNGQPTINENNIVSGYPGNLECKRDIEYKENNWSYQVNILSKEKWDKYKEKAIISNKEGNYQIVFNRADIFRFDELFFRIDFANFFEDEPRIYITADEKPLSWKIKDISMPKSPLYWLLKIKPKDDNAIYQSSQDHKFIQQDIDIYRDYASNPKPTFPTIEQKSLYLETAMAADDFYWLYNAYKLVKEKDFIQNYKLLELNYFFGATDYTAVYSVGRILMGYQYWNFELFKKSPDTLFHEFSHFLDEKFLRSVTYYCEGENNKVCQYNDNHQGYTNDYTSDSLKEAFANFFPFYLQDEIIGANNYKKVMNFLNFEVDPLKKLFEEYKKIWYNVDDNSVAYKEKKSNNYSIYRVEEQLFVGIFQYLFEENSEITESAAKEFIYSFGKSATIYDLYRYLLDYSTISKSKIDDIFQKAGIFYDQNGNWKYDFGEEIGKPANGAGFNACITSGTNYYYEEKRNFCEKIDWISARPERRMTILPGSYFRLNASTATKVIKDKDFNIDRPYNTYTFALANSSNTQTFDIFDNSEFYYELPYFDDKLIILAENSPDYYVIESEDYWNSATSDNFSYIADYKFRTIVNPDELSQKHQQDYANQQQTLLDQGISPEDTAKALSDLKAKQDQEMSETLANKDLKPMTLERALEIEKQKEEAQQIEQELQDQKPDQEKTEPEKQEEQLEQKLEEIIDKKEEIIEQVTLTCQEVANQHLDEFNQRVSDGANEEDLRASQWWQSILIQDTECFSQNKEEIVELNEQQDQIQEELIDNKFDQLVDEDNNPLINDKMKDSRAEVREEEREAKKNIENQLTTNEIMVLTQLQEKIQQKEVLESKKEESKDEAEKQQIQSDINEVNNQINELKQAVEPEKLIIKNLGDYQETFEKTFDIEVKKKSFWQKITNFFVNIYKVIVNLFLGKTNAQEIDNKPAVYFTLSAGDKVESSQITQANPGQIITANVSNFVNSKNIQIYIDNTFVADAKIIGGGFGINIAIPQEIRAGKHTIKIIGDAKNEYVYKDIEIEKFSSFVSVWIYWLIAFVLACVLVFMIYKYYKLRSDLKNY